MAINEDDKRDEDVPAQAVAALTAAHRRALAAGRTLVLVQDGMLVRIDRNGTHPIRRISGRERVSTLNKQAS